MADVVRAVRSGDLELMKKAMSKPGFCVNAPASGGRTPLHHAVDCGKIDVCQALVQRGADVDLEDQGECTPVYIALLKNNKRMVEWLLEQGADPKGKSPDGDKYADCTEDEGMKELFKKKWN
ncbi:predicted protein [Nematostella vectensis]|uniref:Myotrophin n=1 Tax=Nematostella vectensis TaxID=45351 RepID=A7S233_NEMVE|nr:myotrophin isoform X2 [Nematostella vectensis]EDO42214.1 predicted protein [Nematostella vectensis]|eukprot:XP_001634277.1 predicted protein [Nematostella vectensis]